MEENLEDRPEYVQASEVTVRQPDGTLSTLPPYGRHELYSIVAKGNKRLKRKGAKHGENES